MKRYRSRPVVVDAVRWDGSTKAWNAIRENCVWQKVTLDPVDGLRIWTPQGIQHVNDGDYVVRGVVDEVCAVTCDVFEKTYESADDHVPPCNCYARDCTCGGSRRADSMRQSDR